MGLFFVDNQNPSTIAKDRLKMLILAERIQCTPDLLKMLMNELIQSANKYVTIRENQVSVIYDMPNNKITVHFPLEHDHFRKRN